jgi:predicted RNA-binding protein with PUA-like domain
MKKFSFYLTISLVASYLMFSCSSSKNKGVVGSAPIQHYAITNNQTSTSTSNDYSEKEFYAAFRQNLKQSKTEDVAEVLKTVVASTNSTVALIEKHIAKVEKLKNGQRLSKTEIKEVRKDVKEAKKQVATKESAGKNQTVIFVLALLSFLLVAGLVPIHRFMLGGSKNVTAGILQIVFGVLTLGCVSFIWGLIDVIRIATGNLKPGSGDYNPKW